MQKNKVVTDRITPAPQPSVVETNPDEQSVW